MGRVADQTGALDGGWSPPTRLSTLLFHAKTAAFQARRAAANLSSRELKRHPRGDPADFPVIVGQSRTPLWSDARPGENTLQQGKVENLRRAAAAIDGATVPPDGLFSFWRQVGRATRSRGYVAGRMLKEGCLVPAVGGGLCQLSNALYDAALQSGCAIVERHAHSRVVPGSAAAAGRDATVAWNYVDLRFRPGRPLLIEARLTRDELVVRMRAGYGESFEASSQPTAPTPTRSARTCATCDQVRCHRHEPAARTVEARAAFLLDEAWPELRAFVLDAGAPGDVLAAPFQGRLQRTPRYAWEPGRIGRVRAAPLTALRRSLDLRLNGKNGAAARAAELAGASRLARALDRFAPPDARQLYVAQSLLPELWLDGRLGGREVTVLMTRTPIAVLQERLDAAFAAHPERGSLGDFRADPRLARAEMEALEHAARIVTPHAELAGLFPAKTTRLPWRQPSPLRREAPAPDSRRIAFPGPVAARKGAYEVREAARLLGLQVVLPGAELEGPDFWAGVDILRPARPQAWLDGVAAVVQPALVEHEPRRLLQALAGGAPVVATRACGLSGFENLVLVAPQDPEALCDALARLLAAPTA